MKHEPFVKRPTQYDNLRIVLLGAPGSGKGTQGVMISANTGIEKISTGDLLREEVARGAELGKKAQDFMNKGLLVPDDLVLKTLRNELLARQRYSMSFMLDGFPRNKAQAIALDALLASINQPLSLVLYLETHASDLKERLKARLTCATCNAVYNINLDPPAVAGICDRCQSELHRRQDDDEKTIRERLAVFEKKTKPVIGYYKDQGKLVKVIANGLAQEISSEIHKIIRTYTSGSKRGGGAFGSQAT